MNGAWLAAGAVLVAAASEPDTQETLVWDMSFDEAPGGPAAADADSSRAGPAALPPARDLAGYVRTILEPPDEPSLAETIAAAISAAGLEPGEEAGIARDAAWGALLPRVRVTVRRDWEHDRSLDLDDAGGGDFGIDTDDDLELSVTAQWQLSDLVAPPAEAVARRLAMQAEVARRELRIAVAKTYVERRVLRLQWDAATPGGEAARAAIAAAIAERTARLDALTGGFFGEAVNGIGRTGRGDGWSSGETDGTR